MKKTILFSIFVMLTFLMYAQHNYDNQSLIYSNNGNVGIGISNPLAKLSVDGYVKVEGTDGRLMLQNPSATGSIYLRNGGSTNARKFEIMYAGTTKFLMDNDGNVGIGVSNPLAKLSVDGYVKVEGTDGRLMLQNPSATGSIYLRNGGSTNARKFEIMYAGTTKFLMDNNGNVGIGTTNPGNFKLAVEGTIGAREVKVTLDSWSDFVFDGNYKLRELEEVESFIHDNNRLPDIPSETEVIENGINLGEMDAKLLQKIEELTLYMIEMNKRMNSLESENSALKEELIEMRSAQ
jgi:hypothetical protein